MARKNNRKIYREIDRKMNREIYRKMDRQIDLEQKLRISGIIELQIHFSYIYIRERKRNIEGVIEIEGQNRGRIIDKGIQMSLESKMEYMKPKIFKLFV